MSDGPGHLRLADHGPALAGQIAAGLGAALALLGPFSDVIAGIGVAILIIGVVLAAPAGRQPGPVMAEWWSVLALAALATLIGYGLAFWLPAPGGVLLTIGAVTSLAAVFFGTPAQPE
ncbi:MAG TPA: hypothetical protein PLB47_03915 [Solirubrobacterales bacterium]|nr:hypothetical protein [Solirubrobacterales bacterium]HMY25347.1 hypothetical protein [Solirubrobacterales bacterium]HNA23643.1 hypothetical protein [Solirubrobacterales bacterium]HNA43173.1 hypothetical protein [Solirubrobacterales bacterium]HNC06854.1 hypothetical protein [Solirubrobacterales bacterium]